MIERPASAKTLVYDSATFNGTAMSNPKGKLVEAYTGSSGSKTTDEFFSYSVRGELLDTWQCTPHSGTSGCALVSNYYHVTVGFFENGALMNLSSSISGLPTQNYTIDAMGRTSTVHASAGQHPVASTNHNLSAFSSSVTFGSGDFDTFYQDPNMGRQTKYVFNVNGATNTGQTNWNNNGSLASLQITDNISGTSDAQTCNYTHDDLSRISSVNCVNGATAKWNQSFTYDQFNNITKSSSGPGIAFIPGYQASTNWITSLPGITPTTDTNGQMTYDGTHNYTWDAEGKMVSVDANPANCSTSGQCLTYDALGRMVEKTSGNTYAQIVYGPQGRFATMNGQTLVQAFVSLPAAQAVYTNASLGTTNKIAYYRHADHLGSSRLATTPTRTLYSSTSYAPYGEAYSQAGTMDPSFTGQEQDTVSGMHDFLFRKFVPVQGRWLSPDPAGLAVADPMNPQSWNRYAYVLNNPMALIDPFGLDPICYTLSGGAVSCPPGTKPGSTVNIGSVPQSVDVTAPANPGPNPYDASTQNPNCSSGSVCISTPGGPSGPTAGSTGGSTGGTAANNSLPPCIAANSFQKRVIKQVGKVAKYLNKSIGIGAGGAAGLGLGKGIGFAATGSIQVVVSPDGSAYRVTTYGSTDVTLEGLTPSALGASVILGIQVSVGSRPSSGRGADAGGSVAVPLDFGFAGGGDVNGSRDGVTVTGTGGGGIGAGWSVVGTNTEVVPVCK